MSKNALGRGLGSLMEGEQKPATQETPAEPSAEPQPEIRGGVQSLLQGARRTEENIFSAPSRQTEKKAPPKPLIPPWYFFAADVLLIGAALAVVLKSRHPMGGTETVFCLAAVGLAAVLGAVGVWLAWTDPH